MIPPITIIDNNDTEPRKIRKVTIHKQAVYTDIDAITYKFADGQGGQLAPRTENAISSDVSEDLDRQLIVSLVDYRDAKLRKFLQTLLVPEEVEEADDITDLEKYYFYLFSLPESYNDATLKPLAVYIHRYLVLGALFDWFAHLGIAGQAQTYGQQLTQLEQDIVSNLRSPSRTRRPLQPYGPSKRNKIIW